MKKQKQNQYAAKSGLSQIGGQVFKQKKKRYDNVTLKAIKKGTANVKSDNNQNRQ